MTLIQPTEFTSDAYSAAKPCVSEAEADYINRINAADFLS